MKRLMNTFALIFVNLFLLIHFNVVLADGKILSTTVEFKPSSIANGFGASEPYTPVWHFNDSTYYVWIDAKQRAWITQVKAGTPVTVPLDANPDYLVQADGHHRFSLGVDKKGYVHVTGDMHHYADFVDAVITPYPSRYQEQTILYWKSNSPEDVSKGFSFAGGKGSSTAIPGSGWMMGRFFSDIKGELYYSSMVHAYEASSSKGQMAVGLYRYDTATLTWKAFGAIAPYNYDNISHQVPVVYWENSGMSDGWFQNYQANFRFDNKNRLYFTVTANTNSNLSGANRLIFAMSDDGGSTWKRTNGTAITPLPMRGIDNLSSTVEVVANSAIDPYFGASAGVAADKNGKIGVCIDDTWRVWDSKNGWTTTTSQNITNYVSSCRGFMRSNSNMIFSAGSSNKILLADSFDSNQSAYDFIGYGGFSNIDEYALRNSDVVYGVAAGAGANSTDAVLKTEIQDAPLPSGWLGKDIDTLTTMYGGNSGYKDNQFVVTSYGVGVSDLNDSMHFTYQKLTGDGSIVALISSYQPANAQAGLVIRDNLDPVAKYAGVFLARKDNVDNAFFGSRSAAGDWDSKTAVSVKAPFWLKLTRAGDVFTGFRSVDGQNWTKIGSSTIVMSSNVYIGLTSAGANHYWYMGQSVFQNVTTSLPTCSHVNPVLAFSPLTQNTTAGGETDFSLAVTNADAANCEASTFTVSANMPDNFSLTTDKNSVNLAAGASSIVNIHAKSSTTTNAASYALKATVTHSSQKNITTTAAATYVIGSSCQKANPSVVINPGNITSPIGSKVSYTSSITNNDSSQCPATQFNLSSVVPNGLSASFTNTSMTLAPGAKADTVLSVTSTGSIKPSTYAVQINAKNAADTTFIGTASATLTVSSASCTASPTLTISPATQTVSEFTPASYSINITNNDPATCDARVFGFSANSSSPLLNTSMEPYNNVVKAGETKKTILTLTPLKGLAANTYTVTATSYNKTSVSAQLIFAMNNFALTVNSDQPNYTRKSSTYNATLTASTVRNGKAVPNVTLRATLISPNQVSLSFNAKTGSNGIRDFAFPITSKTVVGTYVFSVVSTYNNKTTTTSINFTVK